MLIFGSLYLTSRTKSIVDLCLLLHLFPVFLPPAKTATFIEIHV